MARAATSSRSPAPRCRAGRSSSIARARRSSRPRGGRWCSRSSCSAASRCSTSSCCSGSSRARARRRARERAGAAAAAALRAGAQGRDDAAAQPAGRASPRSRRSSPRPAIRPAAPASRSAGDWFDVLRAPDGIMQITVGDVAGHGVAAAALMGQLRNAFRAYAYEHVSPAALMSRLHRHIGPDEMATAVVITIDPYARELATPLPATRRRCCATTRPARSRGSRPPSRPCSRTCRRAARRSKASRDAAPRNADRLHRRHGRARATRSSTQASSGSARRSALPTPA